MKPHRLHYAVVKEQQLYFKYEPVSIAGLKKAYKTHGVIRLRRNAAPRIIYVVLRNTRTNYLVQCTLSEKALKLKDFGAQGGCIWW